ncbi:MAG: PD40 domain-containing protein [Chloroflexi bacterium]|nr:PD40 domain-containing protein [Chloroflexota bacterium]
MAKRLLSLLLAFLLTACQGSSVATLAPTPTTEPPTATLAPTDNTPKPTATPEPTEILTPIATPALVERLVFEEGRSAVFINSDGSDREELALLPPDAIPNHLRAIKPSPDGKHLAFGAFIEVPTASQIYSPLSVINIESQSTSEVLPEWNSLAGVSWAPDSSAFVIPANRIFIWNIGAQQLEYVTSCGDLQEHHLYPSWSPDGKFIAFANFRSETNSGPSNYDKENHGALCLIRPDGSEARMLVDQIYLQGEDPFTNFEAPFNAFAWSPDSRWIAFLIGDTEPDIAIINVETGETRILAPSPAKDVNPDWSPDGTRIAFASNRSGRDEIFIVSVDGDDLINITPDAE